MKFTPRVFLVAVNAVIWEKCRRDLVGKMQSVFKIDVADRAWVFFEMQS